MRLFLLRYMVVELCLPECLPGPLKFFWPSQEQSLVKVIYLSEEPIDNFVDAVALKRLFLSGNLLKNYCAKEKQDSVRKMEFTWRLQYKIDKLLSLTKVALQVEWTQLGDVELEVEPALRIEVRINSTCCQLLHRRGIIRVELDQDGDRVHISVHFAQVWLKWWQPFLELLNKDGFVVLKLLLFPTETAAEAVVGNAT